MKLALDRRNVEVLYTLSAYFMKHPLNNIPIMKYIVWLKNSLPVTCC